MLRTTAMAALGVAALASSGFSAASAQSLLTAQEPSHNIACMATAPMPGQPTYEVRCDIRQTSSRLPTPPRSCPLSWGDAFVLDPTGPGRLLCHGDTVADPNAPVIAYGTQWRPYGFICTSQTTGLTCVNSGGHGFSIARAVQKVF
jgi:hypothetical protein